MQKKYFFFDIDGTLSTGLTTTMPESAVKALALLRESGHFTAIATGRLQVSAATVAARYGFTDIVADGGWSITHDGKITEMQSLPAQECISFIERLEAAGIPWAVSPENEKLCVTADKNYVPLAPANYFPVLWDPRFDYHALTHLYKVYFRCTAEEEQNINAGTLPLVRYDPNIVFVEPKEKQRGIRHFQQMLGIADEDIVVFGDGMNDLCMFGQGWLSVAMGNARPALKEMADYITTDVDKDGLWNACRHFGWI